MSDYTVILNRPLYITDPSGSVVSVARSAVTASYALTASYVPGAQTTWDSVQDKPQGLVSSSTQINTGSFTGSFTGDGSGLTGVVASGVGIEIADDGLLRGVAERVSFDTYLSASVANGTASVAVVLPAGVVSSSTQATDWSVATASVSLNAQLFDNRDSSTFASTGSNTFVGTQTVSGSIDISGSISGATHIDIDTTYVGTPAVGRLLWNDGDGTLDLGLKGGTAVLQVGQELVARVYNADSTPLVDGEVVYINGSQGNRVSVIRASAVAEAGSANTFGVVTETIPVGEEGFITLYGVVRGLNTLGLTPGAILWLGTTPGTYTETRPEAPNHGVSIGYVERVHGTVGSIYVKIQNGYELDELHDINVSDTPSHGELLVRSGSIWVNGRQLTGSYGLTGSLTINGQLNATASFATTASYALNAVTELPAGLVSSSTQVDYTQIQNQPTSVPTASFVGNALVTASVAATTITFTKGDGSTFNIEVAQSGSVESASYASVAGTVPYSGITERPALVSSSAQIVLQSTTGLLSASRIDGSIPSASFAQTAATASYFTGSIDFPDGLTVTGSTVSTGGFTGSLQGTSSFAITASYALNAIGGESASFASTASFAQTAATASYFSGSALFENGLVITGSLQVTGGITGSFSGSIENAVTSSYAQTASVATQLQSVLLVTDAVVVSPTYTTVSSGSQHLGDGTYIVSCVVNTPELTNFRLSGLLSWTPEVATVTVEDEVPTHRSGYTTASVFLRTRATSGSLPTLQLGSDLTLSSSVYTFKFTPVL